MKLNGQTALETASAIPDEVRQGLRAIWVESLEEYIALAAAVRDTTIADSFGLPPDAISQSRSTVSSLIAAPRVEALNRARAGGLLGCRFDDQVLESFRQQGSVYPVREAKGAVPVAWGGLPGSVRLADRLFPVRDQGERGTCVAFASVALREFLTERTDELSEQFLYWACKELDGVPGAGTFIRTAMSALGS